MKRAVKLEPLKTEVAIHWAEQTAAQALEEARGMPGSRDLCDGYHAGIKFGYMQAIADLRMHGYLEVEK